jgi:hypothetical protein
VYGSTFFLAVRGTFADPHDYAPMSERKPYSIVRAAPSPTHAAEVHWVEIFADRVTEDLKQILQEDLDWTTSLPILERLNRLQEMEQSASETTACFQRLRKAS